MQLDDSELRERAKEDAAKWCRAHSIVPNGTLAAALSEVIYAFGEAACAEQREADAKLADAEEEWATGRDDDDLLTSGRVGATSRIAAAIRSQR